MGSKIYTIEAIKTAYKGIQYKSRLEARTAIFFDCLGLSFEYEPRFFEIEKDFWYVPDFYLGPTFWMWIETKGPDMYEEAEIKARELCKITNRIVEVWCGPLEEKIIYRFDPWLINDPHRGNVIKTKKMYKRFTDTFSRRRLNRALKVAVDYKFE